MKTFCIKIWSYFKDSWEGEDGKFSYKRASILVFVIMMVRLSLFRIQNQWEFYAFLPFALLFAVQSSVITIQQLIMFAKCRLKDKTEGETNNVEPGPDDEAIDTR